MTDPLIILPGENGLLRLFSLDMPPEQARFLKEPGAVAQMLGLDDLDLSQTDIINTADLTDIGLPGYLAEGFSIPADQIDRPALGAITGQVLLVRSRAFIGGGTILKPAPQLTLVATFTEPSTDWGTDPTMTPETLARRSPRAARSQTRRAGASVFAVVIVLILLLVLWVTA